MNRTTTGPVGQAQRVDQADGRCIRHPWTAAPGETGSQFHGTREPIRNEAIPVIGSWNRQQHLRDLGTRGWLPRRWTYAGEKMHRDGDEASHRDGVPSCPRATRAKVAVDILWPTRGGIVVVCCLAIFSVAKSRTRPEAVEERVPGEWIGGGSADRFPSALAVPLGRTVTAVFHSATSHTYARRHWYTPRRRPRSPGSTVWGWLLGPATSGMPEKSGFGRRWPVRDPGDT